MRRIGRAVGTLTLAFLAIVPTGVRSDEPPKPDPGAVDRVLAEWERRSSTIRSVEVRFRVETTSGPWGRTRSEGRAVLAAPNLALVETGPIGVDGQWIGLDERTVWNGRSIVQFDMAGRKATRFPIRTEWPAPPGPLRLPFFFGMTVEGAKRDYDWSVLQEGQGGIILAARSRTLRDPSRFLVLLDPKTYLPTRYDTFDAQGQGRRSYRAVEIKINESVDLDALKAPCLDAWTVREADGWLTRLFLK